MIFLLLVLWAFLTYRVDAPWHEFHNANGAWISANIRNYQQYGMATFRYMHTRQSGPVDPAHYYPYANHPPLPVWMPALMAHFAGLNEVAVRFGFMASTLIAVAALFVIGRRLYGVRAGYRAALILALAPLILYFGRAPDWFLLSMAIGLVYTAVFINWLRRPTLPRLGLLVILVILGVYTFWIDILYIALLGALALWVGRPVHRWHTVGLALTGTLALVTLLTLYSLSVPNLLENLAASFVGRAGNGTEFTDSVQRVTTDYIHSMANRRAALAEPATFTWLDFLLDLLKDLLVTFTLGFLLLGLLGIPTALRQGTRQTKSVLLVLFAVGGLFTFGLRNASYIHEFYSIYLFPPLALSGACFYLWPPRPRRWTVPLSRVLLGAALVNSLITFSVYHSSGQLPHMILGNQEVPYQTTIKTLKALTKPQDYIMTNVDWLYDNITLEYYAYRNVIWETSPQQALEEARELGRPIIYMLCAPEKGVPAGYETFTYRDGDNLCRFFDVEPRP
jgi:4-amino-4-deoxy-L-arabinose transferase-like glycosyltransferase